MPLAARTIEPIYLGRRPLKEEETSEDVVQVAIAQNAVLGALVQLASLVRHADDLFCDLADECQKVFEQSERIIHRVKRIKEGVGRLDSKKVSIPVGDLKRFSAVRDHHVAKHGFDYSYFTPDQRPHCIKARYSLCEVTPIGALRGADLYRKDGLRSSNLFKLWPVVLKEHKVKTPDLDQARRRGQAMSFNKKYKRLTPRPRTVHSISSLDTVQGSENEGDADTTSVSGDSLSKSQPSILVAVDTSGAGFYRMSSFRQSLKGTASLDRKKRRRTVSGVPDNIMREIEMFEKGKKAVRNAPRNYSFDDLDAKTDAEKHEMMMHYFNDLDAKMEEKAQQERASREPKLLKFLPCRRSRSLPRCVKVGESKCRGVMQFEQDEKFKDKEKSIVTAASGYGSSSLSLGSAGGSSNSSRSTKRSSIIGNKIRSFVTGTLRPRPKSLDFDSIDVLGNGDDAEMEDDIISSSSAGQSKSGLRRKFSPSMPDDISSLSSSRESKVGPGTYYYFTSSTLPRAQARKYDFPWESLPKDWTTSVKLREISKRRKEERNSSSGNWSGSSNRQSLDSARSSTLPSSTSQHSLSRDSGRDSPCTGDDRDSCLSTFMPLSKNGTDNDTEQWLASLAKRAAAREDAAAAGNDVTESLNRLSELTKQNIQALEDTFSPGSLRPLRLDDEVSSVYSLDQDGFYTSFHNDSGLRRSTGTLLDGDGDLTPVKETHSMLSMGSNNTIDSVIFRPMGNATPGKAEPIPTEGGGGDAGGIGGKVRPPPPIRSGSRLSSNSSLADAEEKLKSVSDVFPAESIPRVEEEESSASFGKDSSPLPAESSQSESDHETVSARLKAKTKISSRTIPSWCSISDEDSTDSSNMCLAGASPRHAASVSLSGSLPNEDAASNSCPSSDSVSVEPDSKDGEDVWNCSTLPRSYLESKVWEEDLSEHCNSWPRSRRGQQQPTAGILKRDKSPAGTLKNKTLNFAPVVSMFDQSSPQGVELPLQTMSTSSSSSIDCSSDSSATVGLPYRLSMPLSSLPSVGSRPRLDPKYQPSIVVKPGHGIETGPSKPLHVVYPQPIIKASGTPSRPQLYAVSQIKGLREASSGSGSSERSVSSSESSLPSLSDCGQGGYLDMSGSLSHRALDNWSTGSSAGLSDIDSSLTYVSMSSQNSTPTNSTLNLGPDDLPTPVNSPVREQGHDTYRVSPFTLSAGAQSGAQSSSAAAKAGGHESEKVSLSQARVAPLKNSEPSKAGSSIPRSKSANDQQTMGSFAAGGSVEAAPTSWVGERLNSRTLSGDSGFSSPTTPTTFSLVGHPHHLHIGKSHTAKNTQNRTQDASARHKEHHSDSSNLSRKNRTSAPPSHLFIGQKNEPLREDDCADNISTSSSQSATPRTDSYRAATKDLNPSSWQSRKSSDISVRPKIRSQSSMQPANPRPASTSSAHPHMSKSMSCPTGVLEGADALARADSYRYAVRNTQGVTGELVSRNTSYRMATGDDDPVQDSRMDAANSWDRKRASGNRDMRRMGITDIDQLKCYDSDSSTGRMSTSSSVSGKSSTSKGFAGINSSRKKMKPEVQNLLHSGDKTPPTELKRMSKVSGKVGKDKEKSKTHSSTYVRFDPIFEAGDDLYSSTDTLRAESVEMIASENGFLMTDKVVGQLPPGRVRASGGRKNVDDKAVMSILDSIKTTIKSMSSKNTAADKDMWRYEGGI